MKTLFYIVLLTVFTLNLNAQQQHQFEEEPQNADCLILKDENSIICKYTHERSWEDKEVVFLWIDPNGEVSRKREMVIPAGHGSVYDFRYITGRLKGVWTFTVLDNDVKISTTFELQ
jgi:hypothetical protein